MTELVDVARADLTNGFDGERTAEPLVAAEQVQASPTAAAVDALRERWDAELAEDGFLLVPLARTASDGVLSAWRNAFWPWMHLVGYYRREGDGVVRRRMRGVDRIDAPSVSGVVLVLQRARHVLSPAATTLKFDEAAASWNGNPGTPGYAHYRWMRRFVGLFARPKRNTRILDFGCGAGWVGIEHAKRAKSTELCSFDPSPQMVEITRENAEREGIERFTGRVGFGDDPPFPAAGEELFDVVISSGVVSFAPDFERWMEGLLSTLKPHSTLVLGDIDPSSRGMRKRRAERPLVPVRELNGCPRERARAWLEERGLVHTATAGYQLTTPIPQAMYVSETRLRGALSKPLLWLNQAGAGLDRASGGRCRGFFDSWVMSFERG